MDPDAVFRFCLREVLLDTRKSWVSGEEAQIMFSFEMEKELTGAADRKCTSGTSSRGKRWRCMYVSDVYSIQASRGHREIAHCRKDGREI